MKRVVGIALAMLLSLCAVASAGSYYEVNAATSVETGVVANLDPGFVVVIPEQFELEVDTENTFDVGVSQLIIENRGDVLRVGVDSMGELVDLTDETNTIHYILSEVENGLIMEGLQPDPEAENEKLYLDFVAPGTKMIQIGIDWSTVRSGEYQSQVTFDIAPYTPDADEE